MRWKCSLLTAEELTTVQDWIDKQRKLKEKAQALPWSQEATKHGDNTLAENTYIQRYVVPTFSPRMSTDLVLYSAIDDIAPTVQQALEEIERQTGWKAVVILGGLDPKVGGVVSHL